MSEENNFPTTNNIAEMLNEKSDKELSELINQSRNQFINSLKALSIANNNAPSEISRNKSSSPSYVRIQLVNDQTIQVWANKLPNEHRENFIKELKSYLTKEVEILMKMICNQIENHFQEVMRYQKQKQFLDSVENLHEQLKDLKDHVSRNDDY